MDPLELGYASETASRPVTCVMYLQDLFVRKRWASEEQGIKLPAQALH